MRKVRIEDSGDTHFLENQLVHKDEFIKELHKKKTEIFISLIESGKLPLRAGIKRIMTEAMDKGIKLGVCTTANERSARAIAKGLLKDIHFELS